MLRYIVLSLTIITLACAYQSTTYTYKTVDNVDITLDVYVPPVTTYKKYPVFFAIHGGGLVVGDKSAGYEDSRELDEVMALGWVGITIDYRLTPGALIDEIVQDVQDAWSWVHNELTKTLTLDLDRITVFGNSAGGGLAVLSGYKLTPRPKVVISFYPFCTNWTDPYSYNSTAVLPDSFVMEVSNLRQTITETSDPARWQLFTDGIGAQQFGWMIATDNPSEPVDQILQKLIEYSAAYNVDEAYPPTYLAHGLSDTLVPYSQSVMMGAALAQKNITYKLDLVPDANHGFDINSSPQLWLQHVQPAFNFAVLQMNTAESELVSISA